jgi:hypothetical protein
LLEAFKSKEVDEFADSVVAELRARHPPRIEHKTGAKEVARLRKAFSQVFARIDSFARLHPLNLYTKARLANRIQWGLKDAGYQADFVDTATREVATHVAIAGTRKPGRAERARAKK